MKVVRILVVSLRGVNFGFWSHLGCSGQNAIIFSLEGLVQGCTRKKNKNTYLICIFFIRLIYFIHIIQVFCNINTYRPLFSFVCVLKWSLLGVKKSLGDAQIGLFQGFNSKFPTSIRTTFICGVPPPPQRGLQFPLSVPEKKTPDRRLQSATEPTKCPALGSLLLEEKAEFQAIN